MPRYFFNIDNDPTHNDVDGYELADLATAKCEAVKLAGTIVCESAASFWDTKEWGMTVADESGLTLFTLVVVGTDAAAGSGYKAEAAPASGQSPLH